MRLYPLAHLWDWLCTLGRAARWCYRASSEVGPRIRGPHDRTPV